MTTGPTRTAIKLCGDKGMRERSIGFVWGYLPTVDEQSEAAKHLGFTRRFSLAVNRYPDSGPGVYEVSFDAELVLGVFGLLLPLFPHDTLTAVDDAGGSHSDLTAACHVCPENGEQESFASATLAQAGTPTCYIEHEPYGSCGGPHPYHDAYVYAFYSTGISRQQVQDALFSFCSANGVTLADVITGSRNPVRASWYRRMLALIQ